MTDNDNGKRKNKNRVYPKRTQKTEIFLYEKKNRPIEILPGTRVTRLKPFFRPFFNTIPRDE